MLQSSTRVPAAGSTGSENAVRCGRGERDDLRAPHADDLAVGRRRRLLHRLKIHNRRLVIERRLQQIHLCLQEVTLCLRNKKCCRKSHLESPLFVISNGILPGDR